MVAQLKPPVRARGAALHGRPRQETVSSCLEEALLAGAKVLSEGSCRGGEGQEVYYGSTMITCELNGLRPHWRGLESDAEQQRLVAALSRSLRLRVHAMRLARAEAARRLPHRVLGAAEVETQLRLSGGQLQIDVDLEVEVGVSSGLRKW
ncbi:MAG: hypothetical protein MJD61_03220 [Proteobacteria bacterium]|nr:hypothetical protein [Pseudomonadota bacterium]